MNKQIKDNNKKISKTGYVKLVIAILSLVLAMVCFIKGMVDANSSIRQFEFSHNASFVRVTEALEEEYEDETICPVEYVNDAGEECVVPYSFEEWEMLPSGHSFEGYVYTAEDGTYCAFDHEATDEELYKTARDMSVTEVGDLYSTALALLLASIGFFIVFFWNRFFTTYEQIWFVVILVLAAAISIIFPEEDMNGINGVVIMALYLADVFLNILCELLISKQSKWNFIVSVFVEIVEIIVCIVVAYRFATMAVTLFFWLPIDIISFINWHKHPDRQEEELTKVRKLTSLAAVLVILGIVIWTVVVGYFLSGLNILTDIFGGNEVLENVVCYLDACASAVGIANGVFILLRYREQWIAWYICTFLETAINILAAQWVLLVLKLGYLTNTTYGYIKWTKYIKAHKEEAEADGHRLSF